MLRSLVGSEMCIRDSPSPPPASKPAIDAKGKVIISLNAVGDAPILRQKVFKTGEHKTFATVLAHLCKQLQLDPAKDSVYVFCNKSFIPNPDHIVGDLARSYHSDGRLHLYYATNAAWG
eukprot:TRINITY_DN21842_c0_g1_i2.p2 TRINITY_DN21842_c0_g1~~TRINITY_DN21842_c0_g1_i2.p2  ORF type:complete len:119 (-),score=29.27 TRINITY_DN21842_c0_g1_i2:390-746(-)